MKFYGWKLLAVMWLIVFANFGLPLCGAIVINPYMAADLHFDRSMLGIAYAIFSVMTGVPGPLVAFSINKKGVRFTLIAGCVLVLLGSLMMALFVHTAMQFFIVFGLIVGLGAMTGGPLAAQSGIAQWFDKRRAFAISVVLTGGTISQHSGAPAAEPPDRGLGRKLAGGLVVGHGGQYLRHAAGLFLRQRTACRAWPASGWPKGR